MTTPNEITAWVEAYRSAWISNDADEVAALFTDDALYEFHPNDPDPWRGRDAIVSGWIDDLDAPDTWRFEYDVLGVLPDGVGVVQVVVEYLDGRPTYDDLWLVELAGGKASRFTEWPVKRVSPPSE